MGILGFRGKGVDFHSVALRGFMGFAFRDKDLGFRVALEAGCSFRGLKRVWVGFRFWG